MISLLIADDQNSVLENLNILISSQPEMKIICSVDNGRDAFEKCLELRPDIALLDIDMPQVSGIQAARLIKQAAREIKIVFYTSLNDGRNIIEALKLGIEGYILKDTFGEELISLLKNVNKGTCVLSSGARKSLADELARYDEGLKGLKLNSLSDDDMLILVHTCSGMTDTEIARELGLDLKDIKSKVEALIKNAGVKSRAEFVVWALKNKII